MKFTQTTIMAALLMLGSSSLSAETIKMKVNGLVCAFCAQGIEKALRKQEATQDVFVSLKDGLVVAALKEGQALPDETLKKLLEEAGYTLMTIERDETPISTYRDKAQP